MTHGDDTHANKQWKQMNLLNPGQGNLEHNSSHADENCVRLTSTDTVISDKTEREECEHLSSMILYTTHLMAR
jgi:hypothetical protein